MKTTHELLAESMMNAAVGVLGSMLIDPAAVGPMLMAVSETDFQLPEQKSVYRAIRELYNEGSGVDVILVNERLGGKYNKYLAGLIEVTPSAANADAYAKELKHNSRKWQYREIGEALMNEEDDAQAQALFERGNLLFCERNAVRRLTMERAFREFWERKNGVGENFLTWGFPSLDKQIHVGDGDVVVIGGRPSAGKTALALQLAFHIAKSRRVGFFSYETSGNKLYDRTIACQTGTSFKRIMRDKLRVEDYGRIRSSRERLVAPELELLETVGMTVSEIGSYAMAHHYDVIFIDYLQKIPVPKVRESFQRVTEVSDSLQQLARRTGKTIVALSQLRRTDDDKAPTMSDLRESGQIEQDADVIMLLYKENPKDKRSRRVLDVAKNKDGEPDYGLLLDFDGDKQLFAQMKAEPTEKKEPAAKSWGTERYYQEVARQAREIEEPNDPKKL